MRAHLTIGIILLASGCLSVEKSTPNIEKAETSLKQNSSESDDIFQTLSKYPSSEKVEFSVIASKEYLFEKPIVITLVWINKSETDQKIMIRDYWEHPIGVGASITDLKTKRQLEKYTSTHFLSSQLYLGKELEDYEITLKPNETKSYTVDLRHIPYFDDTQLDRTKEIPKGKYTAQISYYDRISEDFEFEVE